MTDEQYIELKDRVDSIFTMLEEMQRVAQRTPLESAFSAIDDRFEQVQQSLERIEDNVGGDELIGVNGP